MKKLTLDETWEQCLQMWKYIAKNIRSGRTRCVWRLKSEWAEYHDFNGILQHCFFCHYDNQFGVGECGRCPPRRIERKWRCTEPRYNYGYRPLKFYAEIRRLNKIRLARKLRKT